MADNPADKLSRGLSVSDLAGDGCWWEGPSYLKGSEEEWPPVMCGAKEPTAIQSVEMRRTGDLVVMTAAVQTIGSRPEAIQWEDTRLEPRRYSTWWRLQRVWAWVARFVANVRAKPEERQKGVLSVDELHDVEVLIIQTAQ